jgi:hypothetical protein
MDNYFSCVGTNINNIIHTYSPHALATRNEPKSERFLSSRLPFLNSKVNRIKSGFIVGIIARKISHKEFNKNLIKCFWNVRKLVNSYPVILKYYFNLGSTKINDLYGEVNNSLREIFFERRGTADNIKGLLDTDEIFKSMYGQDNLIEDSNSLAFNKFNTCLSCRIFSHPTYFFLYFTDPLFLGSILFGIALTMSVHSLLFRLRVNGKSFDVNEILENYVFTPNIPHFTFGFYYYYYYY